MKKIIYIFKDGQLRRKGNTIYFEAEEGQRYIPVEDVSDIMLYGEVDLNKKFLEFVSQKEILVHYFNYYGYYTGTFYPREHMVSGHLILKQVEHYLDEKKRLKIARCFVSGAARNIRQVLKYYDNRGCGLGNTLRDIEKFIMDIDSYEEISQLMAIEGNIRERYYQAFDKILDNPDFVFESRTRRPPKNNINTLISFGNSMMYTLALSEVYKTHLDPRIGYLHSANFRRFSLNLDVAEIFKPVIVDRVIFTLIGKRMITGDDFDSTTDGLLMKEKAKKKLVEEFDMKLKTTINHKSIGKPVSYRRLIRLELYKLEKHLLGEQQYEPFVAHW